MCDNFLETNLLGPTVEVVTRRRKVLFPYDAKDIFGHISIFDDEEVEEVEADTGGGWTVVRKADGGKGGVPTKCLGMEQVKLYLIQII